MVNKEDRNIKNSPGIYTIENIYNGKMYIGSSNTLRRRILSHINLLSKNKHHSYKLQGSFNKHGIDNFKFYILEYIIFPINYNKQIKNEYLESREEYYINLYNSYKNGYNVSEVPRIIGNTNTKESIRKGIETRILRGSYNISEETRKKRSKSLKNSLLLREVLKINAKKRVKKIYQYDLDGNFMREWDNISNITNELGINKSMILKVIYGERARCKNFIFDYNFYEKVESYKERYKNKFKTPIRYIHMYDNSYRLIKTFDDYKDCALFIDRKESTVLTYLSKKKMFNNCIFEYGEFHK